MPAARPIGSGVKQETTRQPLLVAGSVPDGYPGGVLAGAFHCAVGPKLLTVKTGQEHVMRDGRAARACVARYSFTPDLSLIQQLL